MKLGRQQKAAALDAARQVIESPTLKRIGNRWAAIGYRKRPFNLQPELIWCGQLVVAVKMEPDASVWTGQGIEAEAIRKFAASVKAACGMTRAGDWHVHYVQVFARTRRDVVALLAGAP